MSAALEVLLYVTVYLTGTLLIAAFAFSRVRK